MATMDEKLKDNNDLLERLATPGLRARYEAREIGQRELAEFCGTSQTKISKTLRTLGWFCGGKISGGGRKAATKPEQQAVSDRPDADQPGDLPTSAATAPVPEGDAGKIVTEHRKQLKKLRRAIFGEITKLVENNKCMKVVAITKAGPILHVAHDSLKDLTASLAETIDKEREAYGLGAKDKAETARASAEAAREAAENERLAANTEIKELFKSIRGRAKAGEPVKALPAARAASAADAAMSVKQ